MQPSAFSLMLCSLLSAACCWCILLLFHLVRAIWDQTDFFFETAMNCMLKLARFLYILRFVYPRKVHSDLNSFSINNDILCLAAFFMELVGFLCWHSFLGFSLVEGMEFSDCFFTLVSSEINFRLIDTCILTGLEKIFSLFHSLQILQ